MNPQLQIMIQQAIQAFQSNNYDRADSILKKVLQIESKNIPALHVLGLIRSSQGKLDEAIEFLAKAIKISPNDSSLQYNFAKALSDNGLDARSLPHHKKAVGLMPENPDAWINYGKTLSNLASFEEAIECYNTALRLRPKYPEALINKGAALKELGLYIEAIAMAEAALNINPNLAEAWSNKGVALKEIKRYNESLAAYEKAISINPNSAESWSNKGAVLNQLKRFEESINAFDRAIGINPEYAEPWSNKGLAFKELKKYKESIDAFDCAIKINPHFADAKFNKGCTQLYYLNFEDGWKGYEYRWNIARPDSSNLISTKSKWGGDKKTNRLLIWGEQGIGDQILFSSVLNELRDFPQQKIISLDRRLIPIFKRSFPDYYFIEKNELIPEDDYDEHIAIGSLAQYFRKNIEEFKGVHHPYLYPDSEKVQSIRASLNANNKKTIGLSWRSTNPRLGDDKSAPLKVFEHILINDHVQFINLQHGDISEELLSLREGLRKSIITIPNIDLFSDVDGALSIIAACDQIITTSNTTAHLAAACGKEVLLLLPYSVGKFWYWHDINGQSFVYPSVKIYKQLHQGDWSVPIDDIRAHIDRLT